MTDRPLDQVGRSPSNGRILVLLDGSRMSLAALDAAVEIAARTGTEVQGVFVEELNILRSAGYGFSCEVGSVSGVSRPVSVAELERRMQRLANQARRALESAVAQQGVRSTLSVARGRVVEEVLALTEPEDLLVLGRVGWSAPDARLGSTARGLLRKSPARLLLWCEKQATPQSRIVVFLNDHEDANHRAAKAAADVVRGAGQPVTVLLGPASSLSKASLASLKRSIGVPDSEVRVQQLPATDPETVTQILRKERASQLVLSRRCALLCEPGAEHFLAALDLPVIVTP
ncbi:universal stress protein [Marinobacter sp.]|uniref:universal stress protein n=1 Tax=Marinobacter sp. TaxID=50741 RepID=UPI003567896E